MVTMVPAGAPLDAVGTSVLAGVQTAGLVAGSSKVTRRGSLVVLVAGAPRGTADQRNGAGMILDLLLTAVDARSAGAVLAGPVASGSADGLVGELRRDQRAAGVVSSVDVADRPAGPAVAVLALADQLAGHAGQFGTPGSADGALPASQAMPR
jgi:hypothetical protein